MKQLVRFTGESGNVIAEGVFEGGEKIVLEKIEQYIEGNNIFRVPNYYTELFPSTYVVSSKIASFTITKNK